MGDLPKIPSDFRDVLIGAFVDVVLGAENLVDELAKSQEKKLTDELRAAKPGDKFKDQKVLHVDAAADTITLRVRLSNIAVPAVPRLKLGTVQADLLVERWVNLTDPSKKRVNVVGVSGYALEIDVAEENAYQVRLGYAEDDSIANQSKMLFASVKWNAPSFSLVGLLGQSDVGGLLIDVTAEAPVPIPLGPTMTGLKGVGLLFGRRFAPLLGDAVPETAMAKLAEASAIDYVDWSLKPLGLDTWAAVPEAIDTYGIKAVLVDMLAGGGLGKLTEFGLAYISFGPTIIGGGNLKILEMMDAGRLTGAVDFKSQSILVRAVESVDVIPWAHGAIKAEGTVELSASLRDPSKFYIAIGNRAMDGCTMKVLGCIELHGGLRISFNEGVAIRASGRLSAEGEVVGFGGGFDMWIDAEGSIGWNPINVHCRLYVGGSIWVEALGGKLGFGGAMHTEMSYKQPFVVHVDFDFTVTVFFVDVHIPVKILDIQERKPSNPIPALTTDSNAVPHMHAPSGFAGQLDAGHKSLWPDSMFLLDFQRPVGGSGIIVNPSSDYRSEAGIDVWHRFSDLKIERKDPVTGIYSMVPEVRASWLLNAHPDGTSPSSRLAIPCNDPLAWLSRFDYAQPAKAERVERFRLQTFGYGPARRFDMTPGGGAAVARFEEVEFQSTEAMSLVPVPWALGYGRALGVRRGDLRFARGPEGSRAAFSVARCELRFVGQSERPPRIVLANGVAGPTTRVRDLEGATEWSVEVTRSAAQAPMPLRIGDGEDELLIVAVGYSELETIEHGIPDVSVLAPGDYRVTVAGESVASFQGTAADSPADWGFIKDFQVVAPPLRPYVRYSTAGDERVFGVAAGGWNPNPAGQGFGHYLDHLAQVRSRVGYLGQIYPKLFVRCGDGEPDIAVDVEPCAQATPSVAKASGEWRIETGQAVPVESELSFRVTVAKGSYRMSVRRTGMDGVTPADVVDEWEYRVSGYPSAAAHLSVGSMLSASIGPWGERPLANVRPAPLPHAFDFDSQKPASASEPWVLPSQFGAFGSTTNCQAGLSFLRLLDWCGALREPFWADGEGPFARPGTPDLCIVSDRARVPCALLIRTSEPCDWRRINIVAVTGYGGTAARRLETKLVPSVDGCQCLVVLLAEGVATRVPAGDLALRIRFALDVPGLPRLTRWDDPAAVFEEVVTMFAQPHGDAWWEN